MNRPWVRNVRELRNAIERAILLNDGPLIAADQLSFLDGKRERFLPVWSMHPRFTFPRQA